jgi:hypothetical protein
VLLLEDVASTVTGSRQLPGPVGRQRRCRSGRQPAKGPARFAARERRELGTQERGMRQRHRAGWRRRPRTEVGVPVGRQ